MPIERTLWHRRITRDGVHVAADVIPAQSDGPFPAVIERTSYGRQLTMPLGTRTDWFE